MRRTILVATCHKNTFLRLLQTTYVDRFDFGLKARWVDPWRPYHFLEKISCAVLLCGNDQTLLKNIFGHKIG